MSSSWLENRSNRTFIGVGGGGGATPQLPPFVRQDGNSNLKNKKDVPRFCLQLEF